MAPFFKGRKRGCNAGNFRVIENTVVESNLVDKAFEPLLLGERSTDTPDAWSARADRRSVDTLVQDTIDVEFGSTWGGSPEADGNVCPSAGGQKTGGSVVVFESMNGKSKPGAMGAESGGVSKAEDRIHPGEIVWTDPGTEGEFGINRAWLCC